MKRIDVFTPYGIVEFVYEDEYDEFPITKSTPPQAEEFLQTWLDNNDFRAPDGGRPVVFPPNYHVLKWLDGQGITVIELA
ncbi:hypothetical protein ACWIUH_01470 [Ursidibacter arcticus]